MEKTPEELFAEILEDCDINKDTFPSLERIRWALEEFTRRTGLTLTFRSKRRGE